MQPWVWLIIIIVIILIVWWLMSRSAKTYEAGFEIDHAQPASPEEIEQSPETADTAPAPGSRPDDLTRLEGIGPKVKALLQEAGIATFAQLASADVSRLKEILDANDLQFMDPASWPEQAKLAAEGKVEELKILQDSLKGGRKVS
jgi:predicted flap endonuclease-1-like 5' DNA nuclease